MNRRGGGRGAASNLPIPKHSRGSPANSAASSPHGGRGRSSLTHSAEDLTRQHGSSLSPVSAARGRVPSPGARRAPSPGEPRRRSLLSPARPLSQVAAPQQSGVRYITEDMIRKVAKEDNLDIITSLNLTLTKEGGKKIKYIENLDRLRKLQTLGLSYNLIEKMEKLDKLVKLRDLNLANNMLTKIEGIESLTSLQSLNVSDNQIEHIPQWFAKKLRAMRTFRIARNNLGSLSEISKLKPLPDLIQLDVAENPLSELPHCRLYVIFHLRTVEILDGQTIHDRERSQAQNRFALDEVEQLEKKLEQEEMKYRQLEDSHSKSLQEKSLQESSQTQLKSKEKELLEKLKQLEQESAAKDDLLKKKTSDLNKASNKHYQLEQELAFYKIDSKFDTLKSAPTLHVENADDSGDLQESPYIGKARFRANQYAQETSFGASPQRATIHSARASPGIVRRSLSPPSKDKMHSALDAELEQKHSEVQKTEEKLRALQDDLSLTERRLINATTELKKISTDRNTPEPFRDDNKYKIRQRLARKMQRVNELRDSATQMESEIDRKHEKMSQERNELHRMQSDLANSDPHSFGYERKQKQMLDKESQINENSHRQIELQKELEEALGDIARETADIKKLEEQLSADQIEQNEELRTELDDIVSGLSGYLENVKGQSKQHKQEFEMLIQEKEGLEEKIRRMEEELAILEGEASNARWMQQRLSELEDSLRKTEDLNTTLQDEIHRSRQRDPEIQDRLERAEMEAKQLRQALSETEKKTEAERKATQKQLQTEKERAEKMTQRIQDVNRQELETKKLLSQLEAAKAMNAGLRDQVEEFRHKQQMEEGGFKPSDLKKRLKKFTHEFKTNKNPIEPQGKNDILGMTFQDLQKHTQGQLNNSAKELEEIKKNKEKAEAEMQTLKEKMKKLEAVAKKDQGKDAKKAEDENKRLQEDIKRLKKALDEAKNRNKDGAIPVRIVYRPDSENASDRASSLNSDEKFLFDELQRELMDLKRNMRQHGDDFSKRLTDAETEAAKWKEQVQQKEKEYEAEMEEHRQAAELMREKQEARIQVIAQDLDQAQFVADSLQHMLEDREKVLNEEFSNADMSNQMITAQEDELARLYDILETQRDEIENLNQILDHLAQQGPDGVGAAFDDELWRIRQEVNNLKETLAMQSAYVQAMPNVGEMGTQADGFFQQGAPGAQGYAGGPPVRGSGAAAGTQVGGRAYGSVPTLPSKVSGSQANTTAATTRTTGPTHSSGQSGGMARPGSMQMAGAAMASTPMPRSAQSSGLAGDPRTHPVEHLGTERRESKAPPGGKSSVGKQGDGMPGQAAHKVQDRAFDNNATANQNNGRTSRRSSRSRAPRAAVPSAFEPVHRPEPYHPYHSSPAHPVTVPAPGPTVYSGPPPAAAGAPGSYPFAQQNGPNRASQTSGVQGASRGVQVGVGPQGMPMPMHYPDMTDGKPPLPPGVVQGPSAPLGGGVPGYGFGGAMAPGGGEPAVAFNPVPMEISYNPGSALQGFDGSAGGGYSVGSHAYLPSGPAQVSHYGPGRVYVPAGAGHRGQHPARIYYPAHRSIPMPAPGGTPMTPMAAGTPIKGGDGAPPTGFYDGSFVTGPPSPIRPVNMDAHPRGILKNAGADPSGVDDSYLFCNVPEHHDLEDYIAELQEKIKKLKVRVSREKEVQEESVVYEDRKTIKRLLNELEDRRDELEGLDLAIERQKRNLRDMKIEEKELKRDRKDARSELESLRKKNDRRLVGRRRNTEEDSFEEEMERSRQKYLKDELECVEKTLAKRQAQLKEAERSLKECNADLKDAKEQARDTVKRFDDATTNLHSALREQQEIEKRSNDAGIELVKATEQLVVLKADVKDLERKRTKQEKLLREINNIISKKDHEFKDLDSKTKSASQSLQQLKADLDIHSHREKEMVDALRDSEDVLAKRRAEIQKMRDQIEQNRQELEKLDQQMGRKRTELQLLQETQDRKQQDFNNVLHDAEAEIASKHREIKDCREELDQLDHQKGDMAAHIKTKRTELQKLKEEIEQEEEVLQRLTSNVNKNKSELKHTFEMQKIEQTELESVKAQQAQKMMELERTQRALLEEKGDLEQLNAETIRKSADLERLRQAIERDRLEVDQLNNEKQTLDDRISSLTRERDLLDENCKTLDDKLNNMKRNHRIMEEKMDSSTSRLEMLEAELRLREREMEEAELQKETMQKDISTLKQNIRESKSELKTFQDSIREAEEQMRGIDQDVRNTFHQRDEAKQELERLNEQIRQSSISCEDHSRQEKAKYKELQDLMKSLAERESEQQEARMTLNKLRKEVEKEENRLNRLVSNANNDLERVRVELTEKQEELETMRTEYTALQKKCDQLQYNEERFSELSKTVEGLENTMMEKNSEKTELAKALSASYEEVQRLRKDYSEMQEKMTRERAELENALKDLQENLEQSKKEVKQVENRSASQLSEVQSLAEKHFNRANSLEAELSRVKKECVMTKKQLVSQEILSLRLDAMSEALNWSQEDLDSSLQQQLQIQLHQRHQTLNLQDNESVEELDMSEDSDKLSDDKENKNVTEIRIVPAPTQTVVSSVPAVKSEDWKKDALRERLAEEQDYLRFQLRQQMLRHSETMESARIKSEETIDCLKRKLNTLQDVLFNTNPDIHAIDELTRARSRSGSPAYRIEPRFGRTRSPSPLNRSGRSYLSQRRSRSSESVGSPMSPERDFL